MPVSAAPPAAILAALRETLAFEALGEPVGNLTVGQGTLGARAVRVALVENRAASGALGARESERLGALFRIAASERAGLVLYLDSAGAKVSEGLVALGAFRNLYRAGLGAVLAGVPIAAVLGKNCFGGASMLAHLSGSRLFGETTQLAMSGPSIIASAAGVNVFDEAFRAIADAALSPAARAKASPANAVWKAGSDLGAWLRDALAPRGDPVASLRLRHEGLVMRFEKKISEPPWGPLQRRDLDRIYKQDYQARESQGFFSGIGKREGVAEEMLGLVGKAPLGALRAWRFADAVWRHLDAPPARLEVFLDCATHAAALDDEKIVLTEYIVDMGFALAALAAKGTRVGLTILGKAGGGVYVALAAPVDRVASVHGADIQVLPGSAVAAILGESRETTPGFDEYRAAGVAEEELKLGLTPGKT
jgi:hypothetical protein